MEKLTFYLGEGLFYLDNWENLMGTRLPKKARGLSHRLAVTAGQVPVGVLGSPLLFGKTPDDGRLGGLDPGAALRRPPFKELGLGKRQLP